MGKCYLHNLAIARSDDAPSNRHYFYRLKGEYAIASTPKGGWFRSKPPAQTADETPRSASSIPRNVIKKTKKRIILSQSMVIDMDPNKVQLLSV